MSGWLHPKTQEDLDRRLQLLLRIHGFFQAVCVLSAIAICVWVVAVGFNPWAIPFTVLSVILIGRIITEVFARIGKAAIWNFYWAVHERASNQ